MCIQCMADICRYFDHLPFYSHVPLSFDREFSILMSATLEELKGVLPFSPAAS